MQTLLIELDREGKIPGRSIVGEQRKSCEIDLKRIRFTTVNGADPIFETGFL